MYELARAGLARNGPADAAQLNGLPADRKFRRSMTIMTIVWGASLIVDVAIGAVLVFSLSIKAYMIVNAIEGYALLGGLGLWTVWYSRRSKVRNQTL
jgi:hypothetical protein